MTVTAPLSLWAGEYGSWHFTCVPEEFSCQIQAHAMAAARLHGDAGGAH